MPFDQDDLDRINEAISTGELRVTYADRTVEYRSIEELKEARDLIITQLTGRPKQYRIVTEKGF